MQVSSGTNQSYYRCVANRKRGTYANRLSVREGLTHQRVLEAIEGAIASPAAAAHVRRRIAERMGSLAREADAELQERTARLQRLEERIRGLIVMQAEGDRSPMVAELRADFEAQARTERVALEDLRAQADEPIQAPPGADEIQPNAKSTEV